MDLALFARLRGVTTVHSRQPGIDPTKAAPELRAIATAIPNSEVPTTSGARERTRIPRSFARHREGEPSGDGAGCVGARWPFRARGRHRARAHGSSASCCANGPLFARGGTR